MRLLADTVRTHLRFRGFGPADWLRVQRIVDEGAVVEQGARPRVAWIRDGRDPWVAVLKRTCRGEVYVVSYRRASERQVKQWRRRRGSGGPQPPCGTDAVHRSFCRRIGCDLRGFLGHRVAGSSWCPIATWCPATGFRSRRVSAGVPLSWQSLAGPCQMAATVSADLKYPFRVL